MDLKNTSDTTSVPPAHFFSLPRELRDAVYELCLPESRVIGMVRDKHP
jgi:hypothetical protein